MHTAPAKAERNLRTVWSEEARAAARQGGWLPNGSRLSSLRRAFLTVCVRNAGFTQRCSRREQLPHHPRDEVPRAGLRRGLRLCLRVFPRTTVKKVFTWFVADYISALIPITFAWLYFFGLV